MGVTDALKEVCILSVLPCCVVVEGQSFVLLIIGSDMLMLAPPHGSSGGAPHLVGGLRAGRAAGALDIRRALRGPVTLQAAALGGAGRGQEGPEEDILPGCESDPPTAAGAAPLAPPTDSSSDW